MNILENSGRYIFYNELKIVKKLNPKNYVFNFDEFGNCWLEDIEDFKTPEKIYDVSSGMRELIKNSFKSYEKNLGVLLSGNKGQGKSLTAKLLCNELKSEFSMPTILINKKVPREINLIKFFNGIKQDYCLFIDEFEKLFKESSSSAEKNQDYHEQEVFLSFMDGALTNKHKVLFLLTSNNQVNEFLINRPSRIKFLQEYDELSEELFNMIVDDKLVNKKYKKDLEDNVSLINLNIDLLISIVDDINLFDKPFSEFKDFYNYKMETYSYDVYETEKDSTTKFLTTYRNHRKYKTSDNYIAGYNVSEILKFSSDEIVFLTQEWDEDENGKDIKVTKTIKIELRKNYGNQNLIF